MENQVFFKQFGFVIAFSSLLIIGMNYIPKIQHHSLMAWFTMIGFGLFVLLSFIFGKRAAKSENNNDFTRLIIALIFAKFAICILGVLAFNKIFLPTDNLYLIPFFGFYLIFSVFEFHILSKLGYQK